jgi:uncharacterized damage-inducible protein DinB
MEFQLDLALEILERTPGVLRALLKDLPESWARSNEGADTWSAYDVVGHLIHGEQTDWIPRAKIILTEGEAHPFEPFDRFAMFQESQGKPLNVLLDTFESERAGCLAFLRSFQLSTSDLKKTGIHPELGLVTLEQLLATWVVHDLSHLAQIAEVMARQYGEGVGPWRAYLPVVQ